MVLMSSTNGTHRGLPKHGRGLREAGIQSSGGADATCRVPGRQLPHPCPSPQRGGELATPLRHFTLETFGGMTVVAELQLSIVNYQLPPVVAKLWQSFNYQLSIINY